MDNIADVPIPPMLMSVTQAAKVAGISRTVLYGLINDGKLKAKLVGGKKVNGRQVGGVRKVHIDDLKETVRALPTLGEC